MAIVVLDYTLLINRLLRRARNSGAISSHEAEYLSSVAQNSILAEATREFVSGDCAPDFPYAALYFATLVWQQLEAAEREFEARAGYKLAQFILWNEYPEHESYWSTKLLRELYEAHTVAAAKAMEAEAERKVSSMAEAG